MGGSGAGVAGASVGGRLLSALQWEGSSGSWAGSRRGGGGGGGAGGGGGNSPSPQEAFLCALPSLNPLSAAALLASGLSLRGIIAALCASAAASSAAAVVADEEMGGSGGGGDARAFQSGVGKYSLLPMLDHTLLRRLLGPHLSPMVPERSLALLAAQLQASNIHVEEEEMGGPWEEAPGAREEAGSWEAADGQYSAWPAAQGQYSVWATGGRLPDAVGEATALMHPQPGGGGGWDAGQQVPSEARQGAYGDPGRTSAMRAQQQQGGYMDPERTSAPHQGQGPGDGGVYWMEQPMDPRMLQQGGQALGGMGQRGGQLRGDIVMGLQPGQWGGQGQGQGRGGQTHQGPPPQAVAGWALPHQQPGQQYGLLQLPTGPEFPDEAEANGMHGRQYQQQYQLCQQQQQSAPAWLPMDQGGVPAWNPPGTCPEPTRYLPGTFPEPALEEDADIVALDFGLESLRTLYAASQGDGSSPRGEGGGGGGGGEWGAAAAAADNSGNLFGGRNRRIRRRSPALDGGAFQQAGGDTAWLLGGPGSPAERHAVGPSKRYACQRQQYIQYDVPGPPPRGGHLPQAGSGQEGGTWVDDEWLRNDCGDGDVPLPKTPPWLGGDSEVAGEGYGQQATAEGAAAARNTVSFTAPHFYRRGIKGGEGRRVV